MITSRYSIVSLLWCVAAFLPAANPVWGSGEGGLPPTTGSLYVAVGNVKLAEGTIWIGVYESEADFLDRDKARLVAAKVQTTGEAIIEIPDLVYGKAYALGLFHDENDNGEFDTNFLGLPAEPWAFSGVLKSRFRLPRFNEVSFTFERGMLRQELLLRKWF